MNTSLILPPSLIETLIENDPQLASQSSKRQYKANLRKFEAWREDRPFTKLLAETYTSELYASGLSVNSVNQKLSALRWWARKIIDLAYETLPTDQAAEIERQASRVLTVKNIKGSTIQRGRHLKNSELVALLKANSGATLTEKRNAALIAVAWSAGLRRAEIAALRIQDITPLEETTPSGKIITYAAITVKHGKGDKTRTTYIHPDLYGIYQTWIASRGTSKGFIFCPINKSGKANLTHNLSGETLRIILEKSIASAGAEHLTWHDFRRTFAGNAMEIADISTVQALMGHSTATTTARYDRRPEQARQKAILSMTVPTI